MRVTKAPAQPGHSLAGAEPRSVVVAFDVDGTLTTRDCVLPFLDMVAGRRRLITGLARQPRALAHAALARDRDVMKAAAVRAAFTGRDAASVTRLGVTFARTIHDTLLRPDTTKRLAWHQRQGHRVVLVSASLSPYLVPLAKHLGVDHVLCSELVVGNDGRLTGELVGSNCRGPEKEQRLRRWLADNDLGDAELWAYGDSPGDRELLLAARHAINVKDRTISETPGPTS